MSRPTKARLKKLESKTRPIRINANVVTIDVATDKVIGPAPTSKRIMIVPYFGSDDAWEAACVAQQNRLVQAA